MIELSDEILNKYIDGDLDSEELKQLKLILNASEEAKRRLYALQLIHNKLKNMPEQKTSPGFTSVLMKKIVKRRESKAQRYFIFSVSSVFILISLTIIGYLISIILTVSSEAHDSKIKISFPVHFLDDFIHAINSVLGSGNISLIGFVFSFIIIVTAYLFFDSHKHAKARLDKL
jgi:hypothetical protein